MICNVSVLVIEQRMEECFNVLYRSETKNAMVEKDPEGW